MGGNLSKITNLTSDMIPQISSDKIIFKVNAKEHGVVFTMIDYRQAAPIHTQFLLEPESELEYLCFEGLFRIECTLGIALANIVKHNANFN